jgi:hypothetical protein
MDMASKKQDEQYSEQDAADRRDAVVKHMLSTPPKPHAETKFGKPKQKAASSAAPAKPRRRAPSP